MSSLTREERRAVLLVHAAFVLNGVVVTMLGPLIPILSVRWSLSDATAGSLFTAQFTGSTLGVALSSVLLPRRGFREVLTLGLFWMAIGVAALYFVAWPVGVAAVFFYGIGFGIVVPTGNLLISKMYEGHDAAALSLLNMSWGIGAVAGPIVIAILVRLDRVEALYPGLTVALVACGIGIAASAIHSKTALQATNPSSSPPIKWNWLLIAQFAAMFFLYVGSENAFGGWVASYAKRVSDPASIWALTPSFFWVTLVGGRGLVPIALRYFSDRAVANGGLVLASMGVAGLIASYHLQTSIFSALIVGFGLAPVYPITISNMSRRFGSRAQQVAGLLFAMAGFGAATLPWLVGFLSSRLGSLRLGLVVPLAGALLMLLIQSIDGIRSRRQITG